MKASLGGYHLGRGWEKPAKQRSRHQEQQVLAPKGKEEPGTPDGKRGVRQSWGERGGRADLEVMEAALQLDQGVWILALGQWKQWGV